MVADENASTSRSETSDLLQEGFVRRMLFDMCDKALKRGSTGPIMNGRHLTDDEMRKLVAYARKHGFLK
jgi:hypothetical protein